ncbi:sigma factor-like helix-turn-helix DNA-binding protein [Brevundimonas sp.]|uniref:sigma factor-like helix-turn-helix DNA-binding protein n=1 Tax=Brevundimonas sp. TaxID=1871086 RepID=UPI0037BFFF2D
MSLSPSQSAEEYRERLILVRAIRRLPRRCRDVFVLHRFAGMAQEQIAAHQSIEKRAVEALLAAALVRLSRAVDGEGRGGPPER